MDRSLFEAINFLTDFFISSENLNAQDRDGFTALHCAVLNENTEIIQLLLLKGAKVEIKDNSG